MSTRALTFFITGLAALATAAFVAPAARAQAIGTPRPGPVIEAFGAVFDVPEIDWETPDVEYRAVFDVRDPAEAPGERNRGIETVARYLNMHAREGVPPEKLHAVLVLHGGAAKGALSDDSYRERYGTANPDRELIGALIDAGAEVVLCGQSASAMSRGFPAADLAPGVRLALSAMTALVAYQQQGYSLIAFY
jgi:intracellular sulfur oxidation DsrE/DsrF family protein